MIESDDPITPTALPLRWREDEAPPPPLRTDARRARRTRLNRALLHLVKHDSPR